MADVDRIARPRATVVEREEAGVTAGLQDGARDHGAGGNVHVIDDLQVTEDHRGAAEGAMPADVGAAGDAHAAGDSGVRADARVVAHLDLVIEPRSFLDHRVTQVAAVDGPVRADFDIVADAHRPNLRNLDPAVLVAGVAEAVGADDGAGVHDAARADRAARIHHDTRIEAAIVADGS